MISQNKFLFLFKVYEMLAIKETPSNLAASTEITFVFKDKVLHNIS